MKCLESDESGKQNDARWFPKKVECLEIQARDWYNQDSAQGLWNRVSSVCQSLLYRNLKEADPVAGASQTFNHRPDAGKQQIIWAEGLN